MNPTLIGRALPGLFRLGKLRSIAGAAADVSDWPELGMPGFVEHKACPACGGGAFSRLGAAGHGMLGARTFPGGSYRYAPELRNARELRRCAACGLVWQACVPTEKLLLELYRAGDAADPPSPDSRRLTWDRALRCLGSGGGRLLDVGASDGYLLSRLPAGWIGAGLEPTGAPQPFLRSVASEVYQGFVDDAQLRLPDESFDAVCLLDLMEHLRDVRTALRNVARCLKPGGLMLVETGDTDCLPARLLRGRWWYYDLVEHLVFFNARSLRRALSAAGLRLESCRRVVHTYLGSRFVMLWDLARKLAASRRYREAPQTAAARRIAYLKHPFRVYWPDHLFAVARKP